MDSGGPFFDSSNFDTFHQDTDRRLKNPVVTFFHLIFRSLALIVYLLCGWFSDSFIASFVTIILLLSLDFWTVKNITGRFMVGLRWWNYINDSGESQWVFEARTEDSAQKISSTEVYIFWAGLVAAPVFWVGKKEVIISDGLQTFFCIGLILLHCFVLIQTQMVGAGDHRADLEHLQPVGLPQV